VHPSYRRLIIPTLLVALLAVVVITSLLG